MVRNRDLSGLALLLEGRINQMRSTFLAVILMAIPVVTTAGDCDQVWRGIYVFGAEVESFRPCGSESVYWADYAWAGSSVREFHAKHTTEPYQGIYVEFRGHLLDEEMDGFAVEYDGLIHISEVSTLSARIPSVCQVESSMETR